MPLYIFIVVHGYLTFFLDYYLECGEPCSLNTVPSNNPSQILALKGLKDLLHFIDIESKFLKKFLSRGKSLEKNPYVIFS